MLLRIKSLLFEVYILKKYLKILSHMLWMHLHGHSLNNGIKLKSSDYGQIHGAIDGLKNTIYE